MRARRTHPPPPAQPGPLIGRDDQLAAAHARLSSATVRLLTITGPAGAGKTRLALAVAGSLAGRFPDGVWFVDLAPIEDARLVHTAIARAAGVREHRGELARARVERLVGQRQILLVLDNFEQVLAAAHDVADLLAACPNVRVLATSRAPLNVRWEHVLRLAPLALPDPVRLPPLEQLVQVPAIALYLERARAIDPAFSLTLDNAAAIAEICVRLDGLPLAIELAAARSDVYAPAEVLARLRQRLDILTGGATDLPLRQRSLEAAFDWGYNLLSQADQAAFRALGVFVGGFSPAGGRAVAGRDDLTKFVRHSLVRREPDDPARFRMLETVRGYALERLHQCGEREATLRRHALFMLELAERAAPELLGSDQASWLVHVEREHDNLAAALRWALDTRERGLSLRLAAALWRFWWLHGHLSEGMAWLNAVLSTDTTTPTSGSADEVHPAARAAVLNGAGVLAHVRGEYERAFELLSKSLALSTRLELTSGIASALHNLAAVARDASDWQRAATLHEQSLAMWRRLGDPWSVAAALHDLGRVTERLGQHRRAASLLGESLSVFVELGIRQGVADCLAGLSAVAMADSRATDAARLLGAAEALREAIGAPLPTRERLDLARIAAQVRAGTAPGAFRAAWRAGRELSAEEAVETARRLAASMSAAAALEPSPRPLLTMREQEVVRLVAQGLTNRDIAQRLVISERTADRHVSNILAKLGLKTRAQVAAWSVALSP